jgi:BolA family transcriptional regulator, general stress-responsive regulator
MGTTDRIRQELAALGAENLEIVDESREHTGHEGAKTGGHYQITIVSQKFKGKSSVARHRMVYAALSGMMHKEIHAISIRAYTPEEF